jgi:hypothetical protein
MHTPRGIISYIGPGEAPLGLWYSLQRGVLPGQSYCGIAVRKGSSMLKYRAAGSVEALGAVIPRMKGIVGNRMQPWAEYARRTCTPTWTYTRHSVCLETGTCPKSSWTWKELATAPRGIRRCGQCSRWLEYWPNGKRFNRDS